MCSQLLININFVPNSAVSVTARNLRQVNFSVSFNINNVTLTSCVCCTVELIFVLRSHVTWKNYKAEI